MIRRPPRSTLSSSSAASDVYKRQTQSTGALEEHMGAMCSGACPDGEISSPREPKPMPRSLEHAIYQANDRKKLSSAEQHLLQLFFVPAVQWVSGRPVVDPDRLSDMMRTIGVVEDQPWDTYLDVMVTPSQAREVTGVNEHAEVLFTTILDRVEHVEKMECVNSERRDPSMLSRRVRDTSPGDPPRFADDHGNEMSSADFSRPGLHNGWQWLCGWEPDLSTECKTEQGEMNKDGWRYAGDWDGEWSLEDCGGQTLLRRRKLFRIQIKLYASGGDIRVSNSRNLELAEAFINMCRLPCLPKTGVPENCVHKCAGTVMLGLLAQLSQNGQVSQKKCADLELVLDKWDEYAASGATWMDRTLADGYLDVDGFITHALARTTKMDDNRFNQVLGALDDAVYALRNHPAAAVPFAAAVMAGPESVLSDVLPITGSSMSSGIGMSNSSVSSVSGSVPKMVCGDMDVASLADRKLGGMAARREAAATDAEKQLVQDDMETQMRILETQNKIERQTHAAADVAANTVEVIYGQKQQTLNDNRKLHAIQEQLSAADLIIQSMERSMWFSSKPSAGTNKTPALNQGDAEFDVRIKRRVRDKRRKLRLSRIGLLFINRDVVEEAKRFNALLSILVKSPKKAVLTFKSPLKNHTEPEVCTMSVDSNLTLQRVIREIVYRSKSNTGHEISVDFEKQELGFEAEMVKESRLDLGAGRHDRGLATFSEGCNHTSKVSTGDQQLDAFYSQQQERITHIATIGGVMGDILDEHNELLEEQSSLMDNCENKFGELKQRVNKIGR
eukprot:TRINITY_DN1239_c0_g1_i7.p1 TRINITY_DN1239_c0_g1~~TRINITY_DN1239_c0_g1_i7.p1  ORF type:complete len:786 (+),score=189.97 TRINITY_DN1239_c0_g1_i7:104-2461(+)